MTDMNTDSLPTWQPDAPGLTPEPAATRILPRDYPAPDFHFVTEQPGSEIAERYTLMECIGQGGMGSVWSAQQTSPIRRLVAVKLVKSGMATRDVLSRFEAERQALAVMDHPNIARILDGGVTENGAPFFVMELVKGIPITQFCDEHRLTMQDRLKLFVPICEAIQHAHQKGVIHRDIKPSNILVAMDDQGRPVPKVIDFGIAKATGPALPDVTVNTMVGIIVGTPQYMSPEQASLEGVDIDTRSDVYSLGVLLYELLTGCPPFQQLSRDKTSVLELLKMIRETDPIKPSQKFTSEATKHRLSELRGTNSDTLLTSLRGELDWVVLKAMEKDRTRRYQSAADFAADVQRYLSHEAVTAHPPSVSYRFNKFLRKNRFVAIATLIFALTHLAGLTFTTVGFLMARDARQAEAEQRQTAEKALVDQAHQKVLAVAGQAKAQYAEALAESRLKDFKAAQRRALEPLRAAVGEDIEKLIGSRRELGPAEKSYLEAVIRRWQEFAKSEENSHEARFMAAEGTARVALLRMQFGERKAATEDFQNVIAALEKLLLEVPDTFRVRQELAKTRHNLGQLHHSFGDLKACEEEYRKSNAIKKQLAQEFPANLEVKNDLASSHLNLGTLYGMAGRFPEAETELREAYRVHQPNMSVVSPNVKDRDLQGKITNTLGLVMSELKKPTEAEGLYRESLKIRRELIQEFPKAPEYADDITGSLQNFGSFLLEHGRKSEAEEMYRSSLETSETLAKNYPNIPRYQVSFGGACCNFANLLNENNKPLEALIWLERAQITLQGVVVKLPQMAVAKHFLRNVHMARATTLDGLGRTADANKDWAQAIEHAQPQERASILGMQKESQAKVAKHEVAPLPRQVR
jgi:eukaryotic-like serine/threonine-protein kinase